MISHVEAVVVSGFVGCIQFNETEVVVITVEVTAVGILHAGAGPQVILAA